jgi:phosphoribosylamine---glycine ligase
VMKMGLIGNGGREHAMARRLCENPSAALSVAAGAKNAGIMDLAVDYAVTGFKHTAEVVDYFTARKVDWVVVGPEATLMLGVVDALREAGIPAVGPTGAQAQLEGDKSFMRRLLQEKLDWGSPAWQVVTDRSQAEAFLDRVGEAVVKPLGLTGGKGVRVMGLQLPDRQALLDYADEVIKCDGEVLLEEKVLGEEFSRMAFVADGVVAPVPLMQDFKYAYDGDRGLMTGGMGAYSFAEGGLPFVTPAELADADRLLREVVAALEEESGQAYRGFLYGQFMSSPRGIRLIEFNVRLGDPEALNLMAILASDAAELFASIATGTMQSGDAAFKLQASVSKYLVPQAYPGRADGEVLFDLDPSAVEAAGLTLIHGSVEKRGEGRWQALGSRTFGLVGLGDQPGSVSERIEAFLAAHPIPELRHRKDVGSQAVIDQKIRRMADLRGAD